MATVAAVAAAAVAAVDEDTAVFLCRVERPPAPAATVAAGAALSC